MSTPRLVRRDWWDKALGVLVGVAIWAAVSLTVGAGLLLLHGLVRR